MRRAWVVAAAAALILLLALPAYAGGIASLQLDEQVERNEALSVDEVLYVKNKRQLRERLDGGPFYAYLSPHVPRRKFQQAPPLPTGAQKLGLIELRGYSKIEGTKWWGARIGLDFTVPRVTPGGYRIDVCTDPCRRTIKDLYPSVTRVVAGPVEERVEESIAASIAASESAIYRYMHAIDRRLERRATKDLNGLRDYTRVRIDRQGERIDELTTALQATRRAAADRPFPLGAATSPLRLGPCWRVPDGSFRSNLRVEQPWAKRTSRLSGIGADRRAARAHRTVHHRLLVL